MARSPRRERQRLYWDSCTWTAQIWNERVRRKDGSIEDRGALCRAVIESAMKHEVDLLTSALSLVEVNKHPDQNPRIGADLLADFFEHDFITLIALDRRTGEAGRALMRRGLPGLKPADAVHLASAIIANADAFHTFDAALLNLDRKLETADGTVLQICKPAMGGPALPLLDPTPDAGDPT